MNRTKDSIFDCSSVTLRRYRGDKMEEQNLAAHSDSLFMFVIGLMMKTYYRMWLEKMKWAHVLALKCEKQKTTSSFFFLLELTSSMWYVALIRCTTLELTFTQHVTEILRSPDTLWNIV